MNNSTTLLVDGNNAAWRAHHRATTSTPRLINSKGEDTGMIFYFIKSIKSYVDQYNADRVYIAWDKKLTPGPNFRNVLTNGAYKSNRDQARNNAVYASVPDITEIMKTLGVRSIFPGILEADDVISWLSTTIEGKKVIISADGDLIQLVTPDTSFYNPVKKLLIDSVNFESELGLKPKEYLYYKAILGDTSDNIAGVEKFGKVKGARLAKDCLLHESNQLTDGKSQQVIADNWKTIQNNIQVMDLAYGIRSMPEEVKIYEEQHAKIKDLKPNFTEFKGFCNKHEFPSITNYIETWQTSFNRGAKTDILAGFFKNFE